MKRILMFFMLFAFSLCGYAQTVNPETFPPLTTKAAAQGKFFYTNTGGEGKILVDSIGVWFAPALPPTAWYLQGNTGTDELDFIGTIDPYPLRFVTDNTQRATISQDGKVGINKIAPTRQLDVDGDFESKTTVLGKVVGIADFEPYVGAQFAGDYLVQPTSTSYIAYNGVAPAGKGTYKGVMGAGNPATGDEASISATTQDIFFVVTNTDTGGTKTLNLSLQDGLKYQWGSVTDNYVFPEGNGVGALTNDGAGNLTWTASAGGGPDVYASTKNTINETFRSKPVKTQIFSVPYGGIGSGGSLTTLILNGAITDIKSAHMVRVTSLGQRYMENNSSWQVFVEDRKSVV